MTALLLSLLVCQTPEPTGALVLLTRRTAATLELTNAVEADLRGALEAVTVRSPIDSAELATRLYTISVKGPLSCEGKRACVAELGRQLRIAHVVSLSVGQLGDDVSMHVELVRTWDGAKLAEYTLVVEAKELSGIRAAFGPFAGQVRDALKPAAATPVSQPPAPAVAAPPEPAVAPSGARLRGVFSAGGFGDVLGRSIGVALCAGIGVGGFEATARGVLGGQVGIGLEATYVFDTGRVSPRLGARAAFFPGASAIAGGPLVGGRLALGAGFLLTADTSVEFTSAPPPYRTVAWILSGGVAFAFPNPHE